jgi:hypothetical protein
MLFTITLGYLWYANLLPFDTQKLTSELQQSSEKIKELSKIMPKNEKKTISYSIQSVPDLPDVHIPLNALHKALDAWESLNPNLNFVESEKPDVVIRWQVYASETHSGLATCNSMLFGILNQCVLDISVGDEDCSGNYVQNDENMVSNIIMHEIGHVLGLGHNADKNSLMYSDDSTSIDFDSMGFIIPKKFEELYVGQKSLLEQDQQIRNQIKSLTDSISRKNLQYDEYYKQYRYYEGKILSAEEFEKAQMVLNKLNSEADQINSLIDQQNKLIAQSNSILDILDCHPNFDVQN